MAADHARDESTEPGWRAIVAGAVGARHVRGGLAYEDACAVRPAAGHTGFTPALAVAVADGHGHARHFRSARGAEFAVRIATDLAEAAATTPPEELEQEFRTHVGPDLVSLWHRAVEADIAADPPSPAELDAAGLNSTATIEAKIYGYGATIIVALATADWLLCAQIGDGDAFAVTAAGAAIPLVPGDPRLDGSHTTSLCQDDAIDSMRFGAIRLGAIRAPEAEIVAVVLATDGFGNAQVRDDWEATFATDLRDLVAARGVDWIAEALPAWVTACASSDGSGDDVTVALMFAGGGTS